MKLFNDFFDLRIIVKNETNILLIHYLLAQNPHYL